MITGKNYVGNGVSAKGKKVCATFAPKQNVPTQWEFYEATVEEIDKAEEKAVVAYKAYSNFSGKQKARFLRATANEIDLLGEELIETYMRESALPEGRTNGEKGRRIGQLRAFADLLEESSWVDATIDTAQPDRMPLPKPDIRKMFFPIGPIAVFGSSNFPLAFFTAGGDTASALASGCPVIVKGHPMHAGTGGLVASAIVKTARSTSMPDGVFSNLNSSGIEVGQALVNILREKVGRLIFNGVPTGVEVCPAMQHGGPLPASKESRFTSVGVIDHSALDASCSLSELTQATFTR